MTDLLREIANLPQVGGSLSVELLAGKPLAWHLMGCAMRVGLAEGAMMSELFGNILVVGVPFVAVLWAGIYLEKLWVRRARQRWGGSAAQHALLSSLAPCRMGWGEETKHDLTSEKTELPRPGRRRKGVGLRPAPRRALAPVAGPRRMRGVPRT